MTDIAYIALGSNLGSRASYLAAARTAVASLPRVRLLGASAVEETAPLGLDGQPPYLNQMIAIATSLEPPILLDLLQAIERRLGRKRFVRWGARTIDLDIVRFGERRSSTPRLQLPHPGLAVRDFWQREAAQLDALHVAVQ